MKTPKFRTWNPKFKYFEYWGFNNDVENDKFYFIGPPSGGGFVSSEICKNTTRYTGLKDKNGKEIYEGDIIKNFGYEHKTATVKWSKRKASFIVKFPQDKESKSLYWSKKFEVIGNIHENKEHG